MKKALEFVSKGRISLRNTYARLKVPFRKTNIGRKVFYALVPQYGTNYQVQ